MAAKHWIVVDDPSGDYWEGSLVDANRARQLESHGVALLPVLPDLFRASGVGGYHKRSWGAGWSLNHSVPRVAAPMTMYCSQTFGFAHWKAMLVPEPGYLESLAEGEHLRGSLQICADQSQSIAYRAGLTVKDRVDLNAIPKDRLEKGLLIGGSAVLKLPADAHYGFALYGMAPGVRVAWAAVSQAEEG